MPHLVLEKLKTRYGFIYLSEMQIFPPEGVLKTPSALLIIQSSGIINKINFDRISIALPEWNDKRLTEENFINQYAITGRVLRWDYLYGVSWLEALQKRQKKYKKSQV